MFIIIQGKRIWYSDSGKGSPVVLLHGYLESSVVWNGFLEKLSGKFRVVAVDLPGHGLSDVYGDTHTMEFMAGILNELTESLGLEKVFMAGHSLGGYVTLAFLELYSSKLSGYCLFHSHPLADSNEAVEKRKREIEIVNSGKKDLIYPENVERMFATSNLIKFSDALSVSKKIASGIPGDGITAVLKGMMSRPSREKVMEKGFVPCLWILGAKDNYIPFGTIQEKVRVPENARVVVLENSGHMGFIEEEARSLKEFSSFVSSCS